MKISVRPLLVGALMTGVLYNTVPAWSQTAPPAPLQTRKAYEIPITNVSAHLIAFWLDPANQPRPAEFGPPEPANTTAGAPLVGGAPILRWISPTNQSHASEIESPVPGHKTTDTPPTDGVFQIPGIEKIVADDAGKKILVFGEEEAVQKLRNVLTFLDRPLRQVELEIHIAFMKPEDVQALGLNVSTPAAIQQKNSAAPKGLGFWRLPTNALTLLAERTRAGQMSELTVPRVTTYNNLNATLDIPRSHPLPPDLQSKLVALVPQSATDAPLELQTPLKLMLIPTINNDETVTVLMDLKGQMQLAHKGSSDVLPIGKTSRTTTIANIRDGDTIALSGFDPAFTSTFLSPTTPQTLRMKGDIPAINPLLLSKNLPSSQMVVFLTTRIVSHPTP